MQIKSYEDAIRYLEGFIGKVIFRINKEFLKNHDPLERMRIFLSLLGNPQEKFKSVLVGGTSGKGSTSYLISHILTTAGYKIGLTTSPHLQKINERLQINGKEITDEKFVEMVNLVVPAIEKMSSLKIGAPARHHLAKASAGGPSYFEILVAMAFKYFADQKVDIAVVEVGMGGEYDATNTLSPLIAVLTNVGLDHTNVLGKTIEKIARTKAGIIKRLRIKDKRLINNSSLIIHHLVVVSGVKQPTVIKIVEERCEKVDAQLFRLRKDFDYRIKKESLKESVFDLTIDSGRLQKLNDLQLSLIGEYQVENASLAVKTVLELGKFGFEISENAIKKALKTAFFPGRFEILRCHPEFISGSPVRRQASLQSNEMLKQVQHDKGVTLILDGAHNPTKMRAFLSTLKKLYPPTSPGLRGTKKVFVVGFKFDKDIPKMLKEILRVADAIIITEFNRATDMKLYSSASAEDLKTQISSLRQGFGRQAKIKKIVVEKDSKKALEKAINILKTQYPNDPSTIIVTGSLYLVGEIRNML